MRTFTSCLHTVRALLRHGASVSSRTTPPNMAVGPALQPAGSTALHFAAAAEDMSVVLVLLEAQVSKGGGLRQGGGAAQTTTYIICVGSKDGAVTGTPRRSCLLSRAKNQLCQACDLKVALFTHICMHVCVYAAQPTTTNTAGVP